jgi:hypothetical protein
MLLFFLFYREKFRPKLKASTDATGSNVPASAASATSAASAASATSAASAASATSAASAAVAEESVNEEDGRDVPETNRISTNFKNRFRSDLKKGSNIVKVRLEFQPQKRNARQ